jgi:hypothetical protein
MENFKYFLIKITNYVDNYTMWLQGIIKLLRNYKLEQDECQYLPLLIDKYGTFWHFIRKTTCIFKCHLYNFFIDFMWPRLISQCV